MSKMSSLYLKLRLNQTIIPTEQIGPELKSLEISGQGIARFPDMMNLPNLESLQIHRSAIIELPEYILTLPKLKILKVKNSPIKDFPPFRPGQKAAPLETLQLSYLALTRIPFFIEQLSTLENLDLSHNNISNYPETLKNLKSLRRLNLDQNQISSIPLFLKDYQKLNHLSLEGNPLSEDEKSKLYQIFGIWF